MVEGQGLLCSVSLVYHVTIILPIIHVHRLQATRIIRKSGQSLGT
jgi:hypothetical protein